MTKLLAISAGAGAVLAIVGALTIPEDPACILLLGFECPSPTPLPEQLRNAGALIFIASISALVLRQVIQARARVAPETQALAVDERCDEPDEREADSDQTPLGVVGSETDAKLGDLVAGVLLMGVGLFFLFLDRATAPLAVTEPPAARFVLALAVAISFVAAGVCWTGFQLERKTGRRWSVGFIVLGVVLFGVWAVVNDATFS